jgi:flagellar biosynthesis protein
MDSKHLKFTRHIENEARPLMATALRYDPEKGGAPRVIASGQRKVAEKILEEARKHNIAIFEDPALTAALSSVNLGEEIPAELYRVVAEVLAYIYRVTDNCDK